MSYNIDDPKHASLMSGTDLNDTQLNANLSHGDIPINVGKEPSRFFEIPTATLNESREVIYANEKLSSDNIKNKTQMKFSQGQSMISDSEVPETMNESSYSKRQGTREYFYESVEESAQQESNSELIQMLKQIESMVDGLKSKEEKRYTELCKKIDVMEKKSQKITSDVEEMQRDVLVRQEELLEKLAPRI